MTIKAADETTAGNTRLSKRTKLPDDAGNEARTWLGSGYAIAALMGVGVLIMPVGCRQAPSANTPATIIDNNTSPDPAAANLAPVDPNATPVQAAPTGKQPVRVLGTQSQYSPQQSAESYPQPQPYNGQPAYSNSQPVYSNGQQVPPPPAQNGYDSGYDSGVNAGYEAVEEASQPPPPLPEYEQPPAPEPNDIWTPGYWNYASAGYFWVPGVWVGAPYAGALWTPGYWGGYGPNRYRFHHGFWARHIGFYGGINYGYGYTGSGYEGGYWRGNDFFYNRAVNRVNVTNIHNVYERNVTVNNVTRVSYNGGNGGLEVRPRPQEIAVLREQRLPPMATQIEHRQEASQNRQQFFSENHGRPAIVVAARPIPAERGIQAPPMQPQNHVQQAQPLEQQRGLENQQQRLAQDQRLTPEQARTQQLQQHNAQAQQQEQQRNAAAQQQRAAQDQARTLQESQRNAAMQQQQQQRTQEQQHTLQQQQQKTAQDQQRAQQQQQQSNAIRQQQEGAARQQRTVPPQQPASQPHAVEPQRVIPPVSQHLQAAPPQQPQAQHVQPSPQHQRVQPSPRPQAQPQPQHVERAQPQPQAQPHAEPHANETRPR